MKKQLKVWSASTLFTIAALIFSSCNFSDRGAIPVQNENKKDHELKQKDLIPMYNPAVAIDSTSLLMYPITLEASGKRDKGLKILSYDGSNGPYWNIAFYDTSTGNSNLLNSDRIIRITSFQKLKNLIAYRVNVTDYNRNGALEDDDPTYVFVSELDGKNFRQITPEGMNCDFSTVSNTDILLIQATSDVNKDKKFGEGDAGIPMIFNPQKAPVAKETFSTSFRDQVTKSLNKLYKN